MEAFCPHCNEGFSCDEKYIGELVECLKCGNLFHVLEEYPPIKPLAASEHAEVPAAGSVKPKLNKSLHEQKKYCPECGYLINEQAVLCVSCGYNLKTGRSLKHAAPPESNSDMKKPLTIRMIQSFVDFFPGLFNPVTLLLFIGSIVASIFLTYLCLFVLSLGAFMGAIGIGAGALMVYAQGISFLMSGTVELMKSAMVDFKGAKWDVFLLLAFAPMILLFAAMFTIARFFG
jgi:ribosomal protein L37E